MENRELTKREVECIRKNMIRAKDRVNLKRLKKKLIKIVEYKFLMGEYRNTNYRIITLK
jgi:5-bromo-4-chloroindolyl phosphate hydrolysis protein